MILLKYAQRKSEGLRAFAQSLSTAGLGGIVIVETVGCLRNIGGIFKPLQQGTEERLG